MAYVLGLNAKLYRYDAAATTWHLIGNTRDLSLSLEKATADITTRGGDGWRQSVATLKDGSVSFQMVYDTEDANFTALQTAFMSSDAGDIKFMVLDGVRTVADVQGLEAHFTITGFNINQNLEEAMTVDVTMQTAYSSTAPAWVTISE